MPGEDSGGGVQWVKTSFNGVTLYLFVLLLYIFVYCFLTTCMYEQFLPYSMIDGRNRSISFDLINDSFVAAVLPHFWDYAGIYCFAYFVMFISLIFSQFWIPISACSWRKLPKAAKI